MIKKASLLLFATSSIICGPSLFDNQFQQAFENAPKGEGGVYVQPTESVNIQSSQRIEQRNMRVGDQEYTLQNGEWVPVQNTRQ